MNKRGISTVIATVLLIAIVIVVIIIIFLWARGFFSENITKNGMGINQACNEISLDASYSGNELYITNNGNIPVYSLKVKATNSGNQNSIDVDKGILTGQSIVEDIGSYETVEITPVVQGIAKGAKITHICEDKIITPTVE